MGASNLIAILTIILMTRTSTVLSRSGAHVCCKHEPLVPNYAGKGGTVKIDDMDVYESVDKSPKRVMILVYDIFGLASNPKQFADILGNCGYRVVIPDFFRGAHYTPSTFPEATYPWDTKAKPDLVKVIQHYKTEGATSFGIFGFCWGGFVSTKASIELSADIKVAGLIHPFNVELSHASQVQTPILLVPSKDELPAQTVKQRLGENACKHMRFEDMAHGFAGGQTDFGNAMNVQRVVETIKLIFRFFNQHMPT